MEHPTKLLAFALLACASCAGEETSSTLNPEAPDGLGEAVSAYTAADCNTTGLIHPVPTVAPSFTAPVCATASANHPYFNDGGPILWKDPGPGTGQGDQRGACVYAPSGFGPASRRPVVIFVHGMGGNAGNIYNTTLLRQKAPSFNLSGDPARPGFLLIADQGRNLADVAGLAVAMGVTSFSAHDHWNRDLGSPSTNPDVRSMDMLVDWAVEAGGDPSRIYLMGYSNGGFFAQQYGIARHTTRTPGGNRVAAVIAYASADPYQDPKVTSPAGACDMPRPATQLPIGLVARSCDYLVPCDHNQWQAFQGTSVPPSPGYEVLPWLNNLHAMGDGNVALALLNASGTPVSSCLSTVLCSRALGLLNHMHWPDGINDGGGNDIEPAMLSFLAAHPHP